MSLVVCACWVVVLGNTRSVGKVPPILEKPWQEDQKFKGILITP